MKTLIETTLNIPVYEAEDTITFPSATYEERRIAPDNYGDGACKTEATDCYIDLYYKSRPERDTAVGLLKAAIGDSYGGIITNLSFDVTARAYRATLTFTKWS